LHPRYSQHELFRQSVIPYLQTNQFRPDLLAIQKTRPITYRAKVLRRALLAVRADTNKLWMLLSENAEVAFPSTTATTSLPTPATTAATVNAAAVAASLMPALTTPATGNLPIASAAAPTSAATPSAASSSDDFTCIATIAAAVNGATPSSSQKRKERP
jgi:hypothetical protein